MSESDRLTNPLTSEQLVDLRKKTQTIAQLLHSQVQSHLETLRLLFSPRRVFGRYVGGKEEVAGADKALAQLRSAFQTVCGKPFSLPPELDQDVLSNIDGRLELAPWEYSHEANGPHESRVLTITSPLRWVLTYSSPSTLPQLRQTLTGQQERRADTVRQFVVNALAMGILFEKFPGIAHVLTDLRYQVGKEKHPSLGELPLVTIRSCLSSFRPADAILLTATDLSGVPAFIELVDLETIPTMKDPLKLRIEELLRT